MGPTAVKLAQWASSREDRFPRAFCDRFAHLQDRAPAHAWRATERALEASFPDWRELMDVDRDPVGTGCVAQVHSAILKRDVPNGGLKGDRVAIKVVHPAARRRVRADLDFLRACAQLGEALVPRARWFNLAAAADEFAATLGAQMDMRAARSRRGMLQRGAGGPRLCYSPVAQRRRPTTWNACGRILGV